MSKAEDFAYQKYPQSKKGVLYDLARNSIIQGYHQAEKDLELTWKDIQLIVSIDWDLDHEGSSCGKSTEEYYKEVLKQFNEERNK